MKIGVTGLPHAGKKSLFKALTGHSPSQNPDKKKPVMGTADIKDPRFRKLAEMYKPKKEAQARIDIALLPSVEKDTITKGWVLDDIADMDAVCHVVRAFEDEAVYHVDGSVNPLRDIEKVNGEFILHDLIFIEKRFERIENNLKKQKDERQLEEKGLLEKMRLFLEEEKPLRGMDFSYEEELIIRSYPFLTLKPMVVILNVSDNDLSKDLPAEIDHKCLRDETCSMQVSASVEAEIAEIESENEREDFLEDLGVQESALSRLSVLCLKVLGLISFFTVGDDEVKQWLLKKGASAPEAAGVIHSDLQRGFIRAEVMKYEDLMEGGSEAKLKAAGKFYIKGKDYIVEDGDILNIRFKV